MVPIRATEAQTRGAQGRPRICGESLGIGIRAGKERVEKLRQLHFIRALGKSRFKVTTDANHDLLIPPNVVNREFTMDVPDRLWVGDITYIATDEGWPFLAGVIDLFSRQVLGWAARDTMTSSIAGDASRIA